MQFRDLEPGKIFTWWEDNHLRVGIKIENQALRLSDNVLIKIHANKKVFPPESLPEDVTLKFGRNGQVYIVSPYSGVNVVARRVIVIDTEILHKENFPPRIIGGKAPKTDQVYITLDLLDKKIRDLETLGRMVRVLLETHLSAGSSDNEIMLTSNPETMRDR